MARERNGHAFIAIAVRGGILPAQFVSRVAALKASHQTGPDYGLSKSLNLKDEIARYWRIANDLFAAYQERRKRKDLDAVKVGVDEWLVPLLRDVFGYKDLSRAAPIEQGERRFPITHHAFDGAVPLVLTTADVDPDRADARFGDDGRKRAAHNLMQELLNAGDQRLWGMISNGATLRLLHDNPSLSRPAYVEADLQQTFQEQLYSDFAALWLLVHASRLRPSEGKEILEAWRAQANEEGERALGQLREGVTQALIALGNGFLEFPANETLRAAIADSSLTADSFFQELLRLVYRLLFLFATEERHVLHSPAASDQQRELYREGYALARLRDRALRRRHYDRHSDLWAGLLLVFRALANGQPVLGLPALGGLFSQDQCPHLDTAGVGNARLLEAVRALAYFRTDAGLTLVNYRDMGAEELGSVYESLLELHPLLRVDASPWSFDLLGASAGDSTKGSVRKITGSYYTPTPLVNELIKSALEPVMAEALSNMPGEPRQALLNLKVLDPACGSGHFLLATARRIAAEIARVSAGADTPDESMRQHAIRQVVQHCIYGIDRNPLAVELCKAALWIETVEPGRPLTFLDSHILCGDSLVGILDTAIMTGGIPDDAYKLLSGDDPAVCRQLKQRNRSGDGVQGTLFDQKSLETVAFATAELDAMPEETLEEIVAKRAAWGKARNETARQREELRFGMFTGAFFAPKTREVLERVPVTEDLNRVDRNMPMRAEVEGFVAELAARHRFFHWNVAFADIMQRDGFDVVIGNPPWDVSQFNEEEYFSARAPQIARLKSAQRKQAISNLKESNPRLWQGYQNDLRNVQASNLFARMSGRFKLVVRGKVNIYALFAETFLAVMRESGRAGLVVPAGIATDDSNREFFREISSSGKLASLFSFENEDMVFPSVHHSVRFSLMTLCAKAAPEKRAEYAFFARQPEQLREPSRLLSLTPQDIALMNPNTRTATILRSRADAELARRLYTTVPVLVHERDGKPDNPWRIEFRQGLFNMATDSCLFKTAAELDKAGARRDRTNWIDRSGEAWVPLYEGKMIDLYDHRAATYEGRGNDRGFSALPGSTENQHKDAYYESQPFYWVPSKSVLERIPSSWPFKWFFGFKDVTSATNERTFICCLLPRVGLGHTLPILLPETEPRYAACFVANMSSLVLDYAARQKSGGNHMTYFSVKQFPVLPPTAYADPDLAFLVPRVLELSYTSETMRPFAIDLGYLGDPFPWDGARRFALRAEIDAYISRLYGLTRDELRFVLDPSDVLGPDYPSETFRVLKQREIAELGEYRTGRLVLEAWDRLEQRTSIPASPVRA
jgi:hypothetical protein